MPRAFQKLYDNKIRCKIKKKRLSMLHYAMQLCEKPAMQGNIQGIPRCKWCDLCSLYIRQWKAKEIPALQLFRRNTTDFLDSLLLYTTGLVILYVHHQIINSTHHGAASFFSGFQVIIRILVFLRRITNCSNINSSTVVFEKLKIIFKIVPLFFKNCHFNINNIDMLV